MLWPITKIFNNADTACKQIMHKQGIYNNTWSFHSIYTHKITNNTDENIHECMKSNIY